MADEGFKRKLTAILSADVIGYSRLMRDDEEATVRDLAAHRVLITQIIQQHNGRVVDSPGDNILAEFASVVDAVNGAIKIQEEIRISNTDTHEDRRMEFRIGINLGDVIEEEERIYGDGVNIAARVEGLASAGGIAISGTVYEHIKEKLSLGYHYLGEQNVKNISEPVRVYRLLTEPADAGKMIGEKKSKSRKWLWAASGAVALFILVFGAIAIWNFYFRPSFEPAAVEKMAFPLPDKPSIAVLPFDNMSEDPKQEYFSDGLSDQIISSLSKMPHLFVIARNSTFTYKGKPVKIQKVAEDLGVKYVLEGSVQKTSDRIRITAQLIDATTGHHVWSESYDRDPEDIFAVQDDISMEIMKAMRVELLEGEQALIWQKHETGNLKAFEKVLQGRHYATKGTKGDSAQALQLYEEAIGLDPEYARAYAGLGLTHFFRARFGWVESRAESMKLAFKCAQKSIALDDTLDIAYMLLSAIYVMRRDFEKAVVEAKKAISLNPNGADAYSVLAGVSGLSGDWQESVTYAEKSIRLNPFPMVYYFHWLGRAYFMTEQYDKAVETWKRALHKAPKYLPAHAFLAASYISLDRQAEAAAAAQEVLRINPKFNLESYAKTLPYKNKVDIERYIAALRKAGLPEHLPLKLPDKPSIAVLAFDNLSGDPEQEYFSDGLSEEIITALSKINELFVIARNSSFSYKGKPVKIKKVAEELGVRYVLEGSVRKDEDRVRITAQLIDALDGHHLWAERYDRHLKDIFALQDEITLKIINSLQVELTEGEHARLWAKGTDNLEAYLKSLRARELYLTQTKENNELARRFAEEAIALDPEYAPPHHVLSITYFMDILFRTTKSPEQSMTRAVVSVKKAIALDDSYALAHGFLGCLYTWYRKYDVSIMEAQKCVALDPNGAHGYLYLCMVYRFAGRHEEAVESIEKAMRLNPFPPNTYFRDACRSYNFVGRYEEAIAAGKKAVTLSPDDYQAHLSLAMAYSLAGRQEEARIEAGEVLRLNPKFSSVRLGKFVPYKNQTDREFAISAMRKAGLPE
jgi:adenylate cyclase